MNVVVLFREPVPGACKTRLEPLLGPERCADLQAALTGHTLAAAGPGCVALPSAQQRGADLGERILDALERAGHPACVLGTDLPSLRARDLDAARAALRDGADVVLGPALDGGFWLGAFATREAARRALTIDPALWGGPDVLRAVREAAGDLRLALLDERRDLDTPADAAALLRDAATPPAIAARLLRVSVIVPAYDEAGEIGAVLDHVAAQRADEVVVADAGSPDGTAQLAREHPSAPRVLERRGGRAAQLNAGVEASSGDALVFLHADSRLPPGGVEAVRQALAHDRALAGGTFDLRFGDDLFARTLGAVYRFQSRHGFAYGDSTIWCRRSTFDRLGGFRALPVMDDYDFVRRMHRLGPTRRLPGPATTSDRRWRRAGIPRTVLSWVTVRWLYLAGVDPHRLARLYGRIR